MTGYFHAHPNPLPPTYILPVIFNALRFIHEEQGFKMARHVEMDFRQFQDDRQRTLSEEHMKGIMSLF